MAVESGSAHRSTRRRPRRVVGPRLRRLLYVVLGLLAVTGANSVYLATITFLEWLSRQRGEAVAYQDHFYLTMFLFHLTVGLVLIVPFLVFAILHMAAAWNRRNHRAVRIGYALFVVSVILLATGLLLVRIEGLFDLKHPLARSVVYWLHVISPLIAIWLYWLHRLVGPRIKWRMGGAVAVAAGAVIVLMVVLQTQDPRDWFSVGPNRGTKYFEPSLARTSSGGFIPAETLMMDEYCLKCHQDAYDGWYHSVHHLSSFNNPPYRASVRETREVALKRDGNTKAVRWCAGCHDPVPFFSGAFDQPDFDDIRDPTAHAGITCTACHSITNINSTRGNADYTIEEPLHYPFANSKNGFLQFVNNTLVKAKPSFHKQSFLKPFHKTAVFCSVCHKVHLPKELTHYKAFLRGQNHYDTYLFSGVSGHGARSFYYPEVAEENCNGCHMPLEESRDFGAKLFPGAERPSIHGHLFPSANTAMAWFRNEPSIIKAHQEFLQGVLRVDLFGVKENGAIDGRLHAPLRPGVPALKAGHRYLLETVIRTLKMGHPFTQGTTDSNEIWMDVTVSSGGRVIGRSGAMDEHRQVDPWSHFVNVFMLDKDGNRIDRRNAQDIFVPLYDHQIPPGAAQVVHYALPVPKDTKSPIRVDVKLKFRKFDKRYTDYIARTARRGDAPLRGLQPGSDYRNELPVTTLAEDTIVFPIEGIDQPVENGAVDIEPWQRWNDYGIGLFLEGKAELRQAADAFLEVEKRGRYDGPLNLARVLYREGRLDEAVDAIQRAAAHEQPQAPSWTLGWLSGLVNREQGYLSEAELNLRGVLQTRIPQRKLDFSWDVEVRNLLGQTWFDRANQEIGEANRMARDRLLREAVAEFQRTLEVDSENVTAHYNLQRLFTKLGEEKNAAKHGKLHARYKPDDNARDRAVALARQKYPAANHAAEALVIYSLQRPGSPGLESINDASSE
ncbi:MAG: multiheme c-type cytochrome [Pirellulaceae bacterium]